MAQQKHLFELVRLQRQCRAELSAKALQPSRWQASALTGRLAEARRELALQNAAVTVQANTPTHAAQQMGEAVLDMLDAFHHKTPLAHSASIDAVKPLIVHALSASGASSFASEACQVAATALDACKGVKRLSTSPLDGTDACEGQAQLERACYAAFTLAMTRRDDVSGEATVPEEVRALCRFVAELSFSMCVVGRLCDWLRKIESSLGIGDNLRFLQLVSLMKQSYLVITALGHAVLEWDRLSGTDELISIRGMSSGEALRLVFPSSYMPAMQQLVSQFLAQWARAAIVLHDCIELPFPLLNSGECDSNEHSPTEDSSSRMSAPRDAPINAVSQSPPLASGDSGLATKLKSLMAPNTRTRASSSVVASGRAQPAVARPAAADVVATKPLVLRTSHHLAALHQRGCTQLAVALGDVFALRQRQSIRSIQLLLLCDNKTRRGPRSWARSTFTFATETDDWNERSSMQSWTLCFASDGHTSASASTATPEVWTLFRSVVFSVAGCDDAPDMEATHPNRDGFIAVHRVVAYDDGRFYWGLCAEPVSGFGGDGNKQPTISDSFKRAACELLRGLGKAWSNI